MVDKRKRQWDSRSDRIIAPAIIGALLAVLATSPAFSLSELQKAEPPAAASDQNAPLADEPLGSEAPAPEADPSAAPAPGPAVQLPDPDPVIRAVPQPEDTELDGSPGIAAELPPVDILTDPALLPEPARRMRELIIEAATTGEIDRLRPLLGTGATATQLAFSEIEGDPVQYLRSISGDGEGQEILAILIDLLNTGFIHADIGEPSEAFVWPYFAALSLDALTPPQKVELLRLVTAGDVEDMKAYGAYNFYRIGITPDGEWVFFMAGE